MNRFTVPNNDLTSIKFILDEYICAHNDEYEIHKEDIEAAKRLLSKINKHFVNNKVIP